MGSWFWTVWRAKGVESLHANFNKLKQSFISMTPATRRLSAMMKEHYTRVNPEAKAEQPVIMKRKRNEE